MKPSPLVFVLLFAAVSAVGCAPAVGDECETALDCSSSGSRQCDRTQPGGYCTIVGCEEGTCPEESVCVKFRPELERIAVTYCMAKCETDSDCRGEEGYECMNEKEFSHESSEDGTSKSEVSVLDGHEAEFCSIPRLLMSLPAEPEPDAGEPEPEPDASTDDAGN